MDETFFQRLTEYKTAMYMAKRMLDEGIITSEDYAKIDTIMSEINAISLDSIYR